MLDDARQRRRQAARRARDHAYRARIATSRIKAPERALEGMTIMPRFDPLAILDKVNRMGDAEIARGNAEWRALYRHLDPLMVAPFVEQHGQPLSAEGYRFSAAGQQRPVTDNAGYPLRIGAFPQRWRQWSSL